MTKNPHGGCLSVTLPAEDSAVLTFPVVVGWTLVPYAHIEIVVAFLVVNFFSFLVIAPSHANQYGRK